MLPHCAADKGGLDLLEHACVVESYKALEAARSLVSHWRFKQEIKALGAFGYLLKHYHGASRRVTCTSLQ